ncbi:hypothetical protein Pfo_019321 [Paulownia fortunei]|nr:hypothetical protein Pfo_019321 [Paulownia fortunei]
MKLKKILFLCFLNLSSPKPQLNRLLFSSFYFLALEYLSICHFALVFFGLASASRKLFPLTPTIYPIESDHA